MIIPDVQEQLVYRLLLEQFADLADLTIEKIESTGTDNNMYKLGDNKLVRLPKSPQAALGLAKELRWLPFFAQQLAFQFELTNFLKLDEYTAEITIPKVWAQGKPTQKFPLLWAIYEWIPGYSAQGKAFKNPERAAVLLARFLLKLETIDSFQGPKAVCAGDRGVSLIMRNAETCAALKLLSTQHECVFDIEKAAQIWQYAVKIPVHTGPSVWVHGDLHPGNVLVDQNNNVCAIIDWGLLAVGDPACDFMAAYTLFSTDARKIFCNYINEHIKPELGTEQVQYLWNRAQGWALSWGLVAYAYYRDKNSVLASLALCAITEVLIEY